MAWAVTCCCWKTWSRWARQGRTPRPTSAGTRNPGTWLHGDEQYVFVEPGTCGRVEGWQGFKMVRIDLSFRACDKREPINQISPTVGGLPMKFTFSSGQRPLEGYT